MVEQAVFNAGILIGLLVGLTLAYAISQLTRR